MFKKLTSLFVLGNFLSRDLEAELSFKFFRVDSLRGSLYFVIAWKVRFVTVAKEGHYTLECDAPLFIWLRNGKQQRIGN